MGRLFADVDISLDGFVAGTDVSKERPLGVNGAELIWYGDDINEQDADLAASYAAADAQVLQASADREGAVILGRTTFEVSIDEWGENPPIHKPCFVLTHTPSPPLHKQGGTSFTFVTAGIEEALRCARQAADGRDVCVMGGAQTIRQYLAAGLLDELHLHLVPTLLHRGIRLFEGLEGARGRFRKAGVLDGAKATHLLYRIEGEETR